ncbi:hypothetical protein [Ideonella alba]|uniref:Polysaccharide biosynthesis protein C-terminal domain-containing protein n=1 Tax=Ideonella alba TaxID=2824118 RepID=A0A940Y7M6_9BURK|nr:hypothetical protein [Ideonella alba]MBQ0929183.1 hypothetical protein [Ideonella alba]
MQVPNKRALASWLYIATTGASGLLLLVVAARYLTPDVAGMWFTLQATTSFVMLAELGLGYTLMREVAYSKAGGADPRLRGTHSKTVLKFLSLSLTAATFIGAIIWYYFTKNQSSTNASTQYSLSHLWLLYLPTALLNLIAIPIRSLLEGSGLLHLERSSAIFSHFIQTLFILLAAMIFGDPALMCLSTGLAALVNIAALVGIAVWRKSSLVLSGRPSLSFRSLLSASLDFFSVSLGAALTKFAFAPLLAVNVGAAELAPVFFVIKIFAALANAVAVLVNSERARLATLYAEARHVEVKELYRRIMRKSLVSSAALGIIASIVLVYSPAILAGKAYEVHWWVLALLCIDFILNNCASVSASFVNSCNRNPFKLSVFSSGLLSVGLLLVLMPAIGGEAAVLAQLLSGAMTSYWYNNYQAAKTLAEFKHG